MARWPNLLGHFNLSVSFWFLCQWILIHPFQNKLVNSVLYLGFKILYPPDFWLFPSLVYNSQWKDKNYYVFDIKLKYKVRGQIETDWFTKKVWSQRYLNFISNTPINYEKNNVVMNFIDHTACLPHGKILQIILKWFNKFWKPLFMTRYRVIILLIK